MRIDNFFLSGLTVSPYTATPRPAKSNRRDVRSPEAPLHTSSSELTQWLSLVGQEPEVRDEVIDRIQVLLASGYYNSAEKAEETALALLQAQ
jgi:hypothetical protein